MTDIERLLAIIQSNRMKKEHEDWGFPRGWNEAFDFVEREISKLNGASHGTSGQNKTGSTRAFRGA